MGMKNGEAIEHRQWSPRQLKNPNAGSKAET